VVVIRLSGIPRCVVLRRAGSRTGCRLCSCRCSFGLTVAGCVGLRLGGELEEHLLQAGAVCRPQLDDGYAGGEGDLADLRHVGVGEQPVCADG
jgi:hypothetical protein